ncbi:MAG: hypothetical protein ACYCTL_12170 [Acidimicrobiales bacterium]
MRNSSEQAWDALGEDAQVHPTRSGSTLAAGKGVDMTDKSPRKAATKKSGKSLKEKRQAKKDKEQTRKGLVR